MKINNEHNLSFLQKTIGEGVKAIDAVHRRESRQKLEQWLNKSMRIKMTDGRTLVGE